MRMGRMAFDLDVNRIARESNVTEREAVRRYNWLVRKDKKIPVRSEIAELTKQIGAGPAARTVERTIPQIHFASGIEPVKLSVGVRCIVAIEATNLKAEVDAAAATYAYWYQTRFATRTLAEVARELNCPLEAFCTSLGLGWNLEVVTSEFSLTTTQADKLLETIGEATVGEILAIALAMGPTKFVAGPLALLVDIVISCDLTVFYSYLVLAQGQLRSLTRWGHLMTSKDQQDYSAQLERMRASVQHWLYSTLVFASGLFVGVDQSQPLHNSDRQIPRETTRFPLPQQIADLTLAEVEDFVARTRKKETPTTIPSETAMPTETSEAPRYQLRSKRQPRYKCGTCGLRDCVCLLAFNENRRVPTGARGVPPERGENLVHRLTVRAEKTYSSVERSGDYPVDTILEKLSSPGVAKAPCPRFEEWTSDGKGLEFTLATVLPPVPSNIAFGPVNFEREPVQMVRCITADLLGDKYGIHVDPGGVYSPAPHWWLLVTALRVEALVEPLHLLSCLEGLRTLTTADLILCFHIIDWYRGKVKFAWWLELIITCFTNYPRIRLLDEWTHTFEIPLSPKAALSTLDTWVNASSDNRAMPRSVWQNLAAVQGRTPRVCLPADNGPGREIIYPGVLYPAPTEHLSYDVTDFLQVEGDKVLACPADLETNSAALRYVLRECGKENVFSLRLKV